MLQVDVTMRFQKSTLKDFDGMLIVDSNSNSNLNLSLYDAKGSIHGMVRGYNSSQVIHLSVSNDEVHKNPLTKIIHLTGMVNCIPPRYKI